MQARQLAFWGTGLLSFFQVRLDLDPQSLALILPDQTFSFL